MTSRLGFPWIPYPHLQGIVEEKLRWLRLPGMARALPELLDIASRENLSALDTISRLADEEKSSRRKSAVDRTDLGGTHRVVPWVPVESVKVVPSHVGGYSPDHGGLPSLWGV